MIFYDLPIEIKNLVLSYNLGDVRLLKIKKVILLKNILIHINQFTSLTLNNIHYFEIDNINITNGISFFNFSELDKLHKKDKPLELLIEYKLLATFASYKCIKHVCDRALPSNIYLIFIFFLNKDFHETKLIYNSDNSYNTINAISEQVKNNY